MALRSNMSAMFSKQTYTHENSSPLLVCAKKIIDTFKEFYQLNEKSEKILHEVALGCLTCTSKIVNFNGEEAGYSLTEIADCSYVYLRRYLNVISKDLAVRANKSGFLSLLDFEIKPSPSDNSEFRLLTDSPSITDSKDPADEAVLALLNEHKVMDMARLVREKTDAYDQPEMRVALKTHLEKIILPTLILACKYNYDTCIYNEDFVKELGTLKLGIKYKYHFLEKYSRSNPICSVLRHIELYFLSQINFNANPNAEDSPQQPSNKTAHRSLSVFNNHTGTLTETKQDPHRRITL